MIRWELNQLLCYMRLLGGRRGRCRLVYFITTKKKKKGHIQSQFVLQKKLTHSLYFIDCMCLAWSYYFTFKLDNVRGQKHLLRKCKLYIVQPFVILLFLWLVIWYMSCILFVPKL